MGLYGYAVIRFLRWLWYWVGCVWTLPYNRTTSKPYFPTFYRITVRPQNRMTLNTFRLQNYCIFPYFALLVGVNFMSCCNLLIINVLSMVLQKAVFRPAKGGLSACERRSFTTRKTAFCKTAGRRLHKKRQQVEILSAFVCLVAVK